MSLKQIQLEVCKALLNGSRVNGGAVNENEFAVTIDGCKMFVFSNKEIIFDTSKVTPLNVEKILIENENDVEIVATKNYKETRGMLCREYQSQDGKFSVYIDGRQIKEFTNCLFYGNSPISRVIAKDHYGRICGVVMPVKMNEK